MDNEKIREQKAEWNRQNMKTVGANIRKEDYEKLRAIAERQGKTPGTLIREHIQGLIAGKTEAPYDLEHPRISESVGKRLARFTHYANMNPDMLVDLILTQWMDGQLAIFGVAWGVDPKSSTHRRLAGKK